MIDTENLLKLLKESFKNNQTDKLTFVYSKDFPQQVFRLKHQQIIKEV